MFKNAKNVELPRIIKTQICIVGAGAAGITLARKLKKADKVLLVESGGFGLDGDTQGLYSAKNIGLKYLDLLKCRLRYFGGTTNHWGGFCRTNDPIDYEGRDELGLPKWPIQHEDLETYIAEAKKELGLKYDSFDNTQLLSDRNIPQEQLLDFYSKDLQTKVFQLTQHKRFSEIYKRALEDQKNLEVFLNLNAVHVQLTDDGKSVESILFKTLNGKSVTVQAKEFVLACHGIENTRLLLNSNNVKQGGIGNHADHLGRYFMDHIHIKASRLIPSEKFPRLYDFNQLRRHKLNANISFSDRYTRDNSLLQYYCRFISVYASDEEMMAYWNIKDRIMKPYSAELFHDIKKVISGFSGLKDFVSQKYGIFNPLPEFFILDHRLEQAPNRNSRIVISDRRDILGTPIADLHWQLNEHDFDSLKKGQDKIVSELSAVGAGRFIVEEITPELVKERVIGHYHHIGTTRMSEKMEDGVVDKDTKVHGVSNLYIAGSSVFPTAGYSGPTMMIVALSIRLAEHLEKKLLSGNA